MKRLLALTFVVLYSVSAFGQSSKARTFNGSSDNLQSAATVNLSADSVISISFWEWFNSDSAVQVWLETSANPAAPNNGAFSINQQNAGVVHWYISVTGGLSCEMTFPDASAGTWHHYLFVADITVCSSSTNHVYVDGAAQTLTFVANQPGTVFGNFTLNVMARNAASFFTAGRISDIAFWGTALTSGNASTLAACGNPQTVNGTPQFYWPINQTSPEVATDGGVNLTVNGTTNSSSSCAGGTPTAHRLTLIGVGK